MEYKVENFRCHLVQVVEPYLDSKFSAQCWRWMMAWRPGTERWLHAAGNANHGASVSLLGSLALPLVARRRHRQPRRFGGKVTDAYVRRALLVVATACAHVMETVARVGARGDEAAGSWRAVLGLSTPPRR